jgi:hypothetical protein
MLSPCLLLDPKQVKELVHRLEVEDLLSVILLRVLSIRIARDKLSQEVLSNEHLHLNLSQVKVLPRERTRNCCLGLHSIGERISGKLLT